MFWTAIALYINPSFDDSEIDHISGQLTWEAGVSQTNNEYSKEISRICEWYAQVGLYQTLTQQGTNTTKMAMASDPTFAKQFADRTPLFLGAQFEQHMKETYEFRGRMSEQRMRGATSQAFGPQDPICRCMSEPVNMISRHNEIYLGLESLCHTLYQRDGGITDRLVFVDVATEFIH